MPTSIYRVYFRVKGKNKDSNTVVKSETEAYAKEVVNRLYNVERIIRVEKIS